MCRIAGIIDTSIPLQEIQRLVQEMCDLQKHGGPDDEGMYTDPGSQLVLGNRRLSLLDLSQSGHMPMAYRERYYITYNGEIYNFLALKKELQGVGHEFQNHTDTEVILAGFSQWGEQSFAKLKGMFAFALWDSEKRELYLVRDAAGIKPLYYTHTDTGLKFASEIRAFQPLPEWNHEDPRWPIHLMAFGHIPEPITTLKNVQPLPKGCFLKYRAETKRLNLQSFKHYSFSNRVQEEAAAVDALQATLGAAVSSHLLADAPIGVFLSGGLDSSILTKLAADRHKEKLNSLSIYFEDERFSEKYYQDTLLQQVQCKSRQHLLGKQEFYDHFPEILSDMDMPCCDGINTWFISRYAKQEGLKAVLSGIGSDELLGGYPSFNRMAIANQLQQVPSGLINSGRKSKIKQLSRLSYLNLEGVKGAYLFLRGYFTPHEIARQLDTSEAEIWNVLKDTPVLQDISNLHPKDQASWMEINLYMQNQLLRDADVMGMANSVEIRVPFLDDDFMRLCLSIHPQKKYQGTGPKPLLVKAFRDQLPEVIWNRPKMGFAFPFTEWLNKSAYVTDLMDQAGKTTQMYHERFLKGGLHWSQLMLLILLENKAYA